MIGSRAAVSHKAATRRHVASPRHVAYVAPRPLARVAHQRIRRAGKGTTRPRPTRVRQLEAASVGAAAFAESCTVSSLHAGRTRRARASGFLYPSLRACIFGLRYYSEGVLCLFLIGYRFESKAPRPRMALASVTAHKLKIRTHPSTLHTMRPRETTDVNLTHFTHSHTSDTRPTRRVHSH